ncbi:ribosomal-protein-alanine N-acetyltransferase [Vibrio sinensis]|uniref:[Ribosomal protein bS18]-alanine N-acetyltransferase n=1 Tax=Vibrio sinensis TaxID=2302434 RepID=A0A3A6QEK2_9VIBR|nr:ribosomal protein S18-alanine N-acetyltransferase [Vibrio sinensis]RJX70459.1 ribosomal-protein-alanine N-acetyltransferase [Vibrio sinensis]
MTQQITALSTEHLDSVWRIEQLAHTHPWSETMIRNVKSRGAMHYVLIIDNHVVGYFYAQNIVGEVTLLNIAIDPGQQGKGYGKFLLEEFVTLCEQASAESAWLEVRASNTVAHQLYLNSGFNEVDRRINYYPSAQGREDAIIMSYFFFG